MQIQTIITLLWKKKVKEATKKRTSKKIIKCERKTKMTGRAFFGF